MIENKNQCPFCKEIFETARQKGCHQRLCKLNPNRDKMLNSLRNNGSNTWKKLNKERILERKEYKCNCLKCNKEYIVTCTENDYIKGKYKKYCCRHCANSRVISEEQKQCVHNKLVKEKPKVYCKNCNNIISYKNKSGYCQHCIGKFKNIDEYSSNRSFVNAFSILEESSIVVASDEYLILQFEYDSNVSLLNKNLKEVEELIKKVLGKKYKVSALTKTEWNDLKKEYISNRSKFVYQEENSESDNKEIEETMVENMDNVSSVFEIFGEDSVTIK